MKIDWSEQASGFKRSDYFEVMWPTKKQLAEGDGDDYDKGRTRIWKTKRDMMYFVDALVSGGIPKLAIEVWHVRRDGRDGESIGNIFFVEIEKRWHYEAMDG